MRTLDEIKVSRPGIRETLCVPENINVPAAPPWMVIRDSKGVGGGVSKGNICEGKYEAKLEFLEGWGV